MDIEQLIKGVQSRFNNHEGPFRTRVEEAVPVAVARVCQEFQWKFLDQYVELTAVISADDAVGKTRFQLPADFFKEVVIFTADNEVEYCNQVEWARWQMQGQSSVAPFKYTIIGDELVLTASSDGATVYAIYTRAGVDWGLEDIPPHLHYAILLAVVAYLAPAYIIEGDKSYPNPDARAADKAYEASVAEAMKIDSRQRGRKREILPPYHLALRNTYA